MNENPLSPDEYLKLFRLLDLVSQNIERLVNQGVTMTEGFESQEIQSGQDRMEKYRGRIQKERDRIRRIRGYIRHKNQVDRKRT